MDTFEYDVQLILSVDQWCYGGLLQSRSMSTAEHDIRFTVEISTYGERHLELRLQSVI